MDMLSEQNQVICLKRKPHDFMECMMVQVDPHLSRTVVVSTKLDTRLPQFARGQDVELFLRPPGRLLEPGMLGGCPFFTWVFASQLHHRKTHRFISNEIPLK